MYKIIACDLDETLLGDDRNISKQNIESIKRISAQGVKFVPATGRGYYSVKETLEQLGLADKEGEYVISYNGGAVTENRGDRLLHFQGVSTTLAEELYQRGKQYDVGIHVYTKDMVYIYNYTQEEKDYLAGRMKVTEVFDRDLAFLKGQDIVKLLYVNTDYTYLKQIEEDMKDLTQEVDISFSANRYIEFNYKGVSKGAGLLFLADLLGVKPEETIAIGDNFNDLSMIQAAGLGVGVQNVVKDMRSLCDYITTATNNESAIAEVIERFFEGKR
jgi:Cof subfamily protein (haloacid dehalogenase superfamily)